MQDLNDKITGGSLSADEWNQVPSELQNAIVASGQSLSGADLNQLGKAIASYSGGGDFYTDNGSVNVVTLLVIGTFQSPPAYRDGLRARFIAGNTNSGAVTAQLPGLGVVALRDLTDTALVAGDIVAGLPYEIFYKASTGHFHYAKPSAITNALPRNFIDGLILSNNAGDATHDIDIAAGTCKSSGNDTDFTLSSALGKRIDAVWAEGGTPGSTVGGFPSGLTAGAPVNNTWYRIFAIWRPTGQIDAGFDTSSNAANLLADATNYTKYRQIGWIRYGTATIVKFSQNGDSFSWDVASRDMAGIAPSAAGAALTVLAPPATQAILTGHHESTSGNNNFKLNAIAETNTAPSTTYFDTWANAGSYQVSISRQVLTDSSSQIRQRASSANAVINLFTQGWIDTRGAQ